MRLPVWITPEVAPSHRKRWGRAQATQHVVERVVLLEDHHHLPDRRQRRTWRHCRRGSTGRWRHRRIRTRQPPQSPRRRTRRLPSQYVTPVPARLPPSVVSAFTLTPAGSRRCEPLFLPRRARSTRLGRRPTLGTFNPLHALANTASSQRLGGPAIRFRKLDVVAVIMAAMAIEKARASTSASASRP